MSLFLDICSDFFWYETFVLQVAAGVTAFGAIYYSLYKDAPASENEVSESDKKLAEQIAALNRESQNTSAQVWGLPGPPTPGVRQKQGILSQINISHQYVSLTMTVLRQFC